MKMWRLFRKTEEFKQGWIAGFNGRDRLADCPYLSSPNSVEYVHWQDGYNRGADARLKQEEAREYKRGWNEGYAGRYGPLQGGLLGSWNRGREHGNAARERRRFVMVMLTVVAAIAIIKAVIWSLTQPS
jgi:hypothetical protein